MSDKAASDGAPVSREDGGRNMLQSCWRSQVYNIQGAASTSGVLAMVLSRYLLCGHLDPECGALEYGLRNSFNGFVGLNLGSGRRNIKCPKDANRA